MALVRKAILTIARLLVSAPVVGAQQIQLTPVVGYRFFGGLRDWTGSRISVDDALSFGGFFTYMATPHTGIEFGFVRQDTHATLTRPLNGRDRYDVDLDYWSVGSTRQIARPGSSVTPFVSGFLGVSRMSSSEGDESLTKFLLGAGAGARLGRPTAPLGVRLQARGYFTLAGGGGASVGCGFGGCGFGFSGRAFFQLDLLAGVTIGLGGRP